MNGGKVLAGIDMGHVSTKAVIMKGREVLGCCTVATGLDAACAAEKALDSALASSGLARGVLSGTISTGIFRDAIKGGALAVAGTVPEYMADAKGALFLNGKSRTVIDAGGNTHKAIRYDGKGNVIDVIQNDKCADGLGISFTAMARAMGLSEGEMAEAAAKSKIELSVAIQCPLSAESEAIDLLCQGAEIPDVAAAFVRFMVGRVGAMSTCISLTKEIVVAGGLAGVLALHLPGPIGQDVSLLELPAYAGAIGAVVGYEG